MAPSASDRINAGSIGVLQAKARLESLPVLTSFMCCARDHKQVLPDTLLYLTIQPG